MNQINQQSTFKLAKFITYSRVEIRIESVSREPLRLRYEIPPHRNETTMLGYFKSRKWLLKRSGAFTRWDCPTLECTTDGEGQHKLRNFKTNNWFHPGGISSRRKLSKASHALTQFWCWLTDLPGGKYKRIQHSLFLRG